MRFFYLYFFILSQAAFATELDPVTDVYQEISDICNPTIEDFQKIQLKLFNTKRPIIERMNDTAFIARNFKLIGNSPKEMPIFGRLTLNSSEEEKENCVITYSSFNLRYPEGVKRLVRNVKNSDFIGHLYYRIGGWPNLEAGDLALAHVPFAFKVCFLREMQRLGYKKVLWLDSSILPVVSLNVIFDMIEKNGFFIQSNSHAVGIYMNPDTAAAFGLTENQTRDIWSCSAAIIGVDFTNPTTIDLIDRWYQAAKNPYAFFSPRSDQTALSILIHQMNLASKMTPNTTLGDPLHIKNETLFIMDRGYVK